MRQLSKKKSHSYYIYRSGSRTKYMYLIFDYLRMRCTFKGKQNSCTDNFQKIIMFWSISFVYTDYMSRLHMLSYLVCISMFVVYVLVQCMCACTYMLLRIISSYKSQYQASAVRQHTVIIHVNYILQLCVIHMNAVLLV